MKQRNLWYLVGGREGAGEVDRASSLPGIAKLLGQVGAQGRSPGPALGAGGPLEASAIELAPEDTKTDEPRLIVLATRAKEALRTLPSSQDLEAAVRALESLGHVQDTPCRFAGSI